MQILNTGNRILDREIPQLTAFELAELARYAVKWRLLQLVKQFIH